MTFWGSNIIVMSGSLFSVSLGNQLCGLTVTKSRSGLAALRGLLSLIGWRLLRAETVTSHAGGLAAAGSQVHPLWMAAADCGLVISGFTAPFDYAHDPWILPHPDN